MNLPQSNPALVKRLLLKVRAATTILDPTANLPQTVKAVSHFTCTEGVSTEFKDTGAKTPNSYWPQKKKKKITLIQPQEKMLK